MIQFARHRLDLLSEMALGLALAIALSALFAQSGGAQDAVGTLPAASLDWWQAFILGMVQGLTEFIPISSTAHLKVVPVMLGWGDPGVTFAATIQLGSIGAVLWFFWQDIVDLTRGAIGAFRKGTYEVVEFRIAVGIALGTLPIVACGLLLKKLVPDLDNSPIRSLTAIAIASIVMGILLGVGEKCGRRWRDFQQLSARDGVLMGLAQALALMPGVSRSGATITAGLFMGLERATAARFSFLLGIPAITLAGLVQFKTDVLDASVSSNELWVLLVGTLSAAVFSYGAIAWLIGYLQQQSTWVFVWYRVIFGCLILGGVALNWLSN
ncbi:MULTISPECIES: undecaprenyl-diphosphate phosphatase [Spirulina sp. CCY15215]|uniref:undecaprenyl-diphosphate phosphatase n=1 Tax=Spirulina sp. CCY15215 TaxID=2767591 RepID=UPI001EF1994F|nr:undecaprenyl-diphosphate phosphatase [Spirulina major]